MTPSTNRARSEKSRKQRFYSWWFRLSSPFLFWMPYVYLSDLREIWKDDGLTPTVNIKLWNEFITQLGSNWDGSTTPVIYHVYLFRIIFTVSFTGDSSIIRERRISRYSKYRSGHNDEQIGRTDRILCICATKLICIYCIPDTLSSTSSIDR